MSNFTKREIKAFSKEEAIEKAPFSIIRDATQAWKNAEKPVLASMNEFMDDYLKKHTKGASGCGCILAVEPGITDTRERPYKFEDVVNEVVTGQIKKKDEDGNETMVDTTKRKYATVFVWVDDDTNEILLKVMGTKTDARKALAELYASGEYKGNATCNYTKEVVVGEKVAMRASHAPSKNAKLGTYIVFGVEA